MHLAVEVGTGGHQLPGDHAVGHYRHLVVDVIEEGLQGAHALRHAALQHIPFRRRDHPGHDVQRERALLPREIERHPAVQEGPRHGIRAGGHVRQRELAQGIRNLTVGVPGLLAGREHLVVGTGPAGGLGVILEKV